MAGLALVLGFAIFPFVYTRADYPFVMQVLSTGFFYALLAARWSLLAGYAGPSSFGHMGFMGIAAFTPALSAASAAMSAPPRFTWTHA